MIAKIFDLTLNKRWQERSPVFGHAMNIYEHTKEMGEEVGQSFLEVSVPTYLQPMVAAMVNKWLQEDTTNADR